MLPPASIILPALGGLVATMAVAGAVASADSKIVAQLIAVDKQMQRSFIDRDAATLAAILSDDYLLVSSSGREYTKADVLNELNSPDSIWEINETSGWNVRVHGDVAIVVATLHQRGVDHGKPFDNTVKFSDTYIKEKGYWRNIHAHASRPVDVAPSGNSS
jgi:ketosteroid isomerase-like protein